MITRYLLLFIIISFEISCAPVIDSSAVQFHTVTNNTNVIARTDTNKIEEQSIDGYAIYYLVIPDTGKEYHSLRELMFSIHEKLKLPIDTMGRYYDVQKEQIILPEGVADAYAGEYFPRRSETYSLSIEHLSFYNNGADQKSMALVAGIYESNISADSLREVFHHNGFTAFVLKTNMYVGCMH